MTNRLFPWLLGCALALEGTGQATYGLEILTAPPGVRSLSLGGSGVGSGDDAASGVLNPAGFGRMARGEVAFTHAQGVEDMSHQNVAVALPTFHGTWAARWARIDYGSFTGHDASGNSLGDIEAQDQWIQFAYGRSFSERAWGGASFNYVSQTLYTETIKGPFVDLGGLWETPSPPFLSKTRVGISARRLGPNLKPSSAPLPREFRFGVATEIWRDRLGVSADLVQERAQGLRPLAGLELASGGSVFIRCGYAAGRSAGGPMTYGAGFHAGDLKIDYAFAPLGDLGDTHHVAFTWRFGHMDEAYYEKGLDYFRQENYAQAILNFHRALMANPKHTPSVLRMNEAADKLDQEWKNESR